MPRSLGHEWRLSLAFVLLIGITTAAVLWTLYHIKAEMAERLGSSLQAVLGTSQNAMAIWMEATKTDVSVLARSEALCSAVEAQLDAQSLGTRLVPASGRQVRQLLSHALQEYGFTDFAVEAPSGVQIAADRDEEVGRDDAVRGDDATVAAALGGTPAIGLPFLPQPQEWTPAQSGHDRRRTHPGEVGPRHRSAYRYARPRARFHEDHTSRTPGPLRPDVRL